jgi:adenosylcobinamide-phosphate synthase
MAGALGVRLEKPGMYAVGPGTRPLRAAIIGEAAVLVWAAGAIAIVASAGLAALLTGWWT